MTDTDGISHASTIGIRVGTTIGTLARTTWVSTEGSTSIPTMAGITANIMVPTQDVTTTGTTARTMAGTAGIPMINDNADHRRSAWAHPGLESAEAGRGARFVAKGEIFTKGLVARLSGLTIKD